MGFNSGFKGLMAGSIARSALYNLLQPTNPLPLQYRLQASVNRLTEIRQLQSAARLQSGSAQTVAGIISSIKETDVFAHALMQGDLTAVLTRTKQDR